MQFRALVALGICLLASSAAQAFDLCDRIDVRYLDAHTGQQWTPATPVTMLPAGETLRCQLQAGVNAVRVRILKEVGPAAPQRGQYTTAPRIADMGPAAWYTRTPDPGNINHFSYGAIRFAAGYVYIVEGLPEGRGVANAQQIATLYLKAISPR